jgi:surface carbohydrate biosynthesis protein
MRVAVIVDSPKRDLDGVVLMAYQLARRGVEAYVVPMYQQGYDLPLLCPDGVIVNYARPNNRELLETYRALGISVMVMDTEGGVLSEAGIDSPSNWAREIRATGLGSCVDRYFFWGSRLHEAFAKDSGIPPAALHVTGCPRYDFCASPWRDTLEFPACGYVLVNTNFSATNPRFTRSQTSEKTIFRQLGWPHDYIEHLFEDLAAVFPRYLQTIEQLARRQPGLQIRIRPHPFEDEAIYTARFGAFANVVVDGSGNVLPAIANAACVLHLNCGTAVESLLLGTPAIALEFLNTEVMRSHASLPSRISVAAASLEELEGLVRDPAQLKRRHGERRAALVREFVEPWFHVLDGRAAERVADLAIATLGAGACARRSLSASLGGSRARSVKRALAGAAYNLIGSAAGSALQNLVRPARRAKQFAAAQVGERIARLREIEAPSEALSVAHARHPLSGAPLASIRVAAG